MNDALKKMLTKIDRSCFYMNVERYTLADLELRKPDRDMNRIVPAFGGITLREVKRISSKLLQLNNQRKQKI